MLSSWKAAGVMCNTAKTLLNSTPNLVTQQIRTTFILKRKYPALLYKKGCRPHKMNHKYYIYDLVEDTNVRKKPPLDIILTQYVKGYGEKGDMLSLRPNKAYNEFLLPGLAVYASPENLNKFWIDKSDQKKTYSSIHVPVTLNTLQQSCIPILMSVENPWVIEKWHIRANFRRSGFIITDESITMPKKEISGPNLDYEGKEFYVTIIINKTETETAMVRCRLFHHTYDLTKQLPETTGNRYKTPGKAIFPEDQEILDSMPRPKWEEITDKK